MHTHVAAWECAYRFEGHVPNISLTNRIDYAQAHPPARRLKVGCSTAVVKLALVGPARRQLFRGSCVYFLQTACNLRI